MNLTRLLNTMADCHAALRLAGFTPNETQRILTEAARDAVNAIPSKPYPDYKDQPNDHGNRNPLDPSDSE